MTALLVVGLAEVLSERNHLAADLKLACARCKLKVDVLDDVLALVAPVSDNAAANELVPAAPLEFGLISGLSADLLHAVTAALSALELENGVNHKSAAELVGLGGSLEALEDLHLLLRHVDEVVHVEELGRLPDLLQIGAAEALLDDDVDQALVH